MFTSILKDKFLIKNTFVVTRLIVLLVLSIVVVVQFNGYFPSMKLLNYKFTLMSLIGTLLILLSILYLLFNRLNFSKIHFLFMWIMSYVIIFGFFRINYFSYSFQYIFKFFLLFIVGIVFSNIFSKENNDKFKKIYFTIIFISALLSFANIIYQLLFIKINSYNLLGFFSFKQHQGLVYSFVFPFIFFEKKRKWKNILLVLLEILIILSFDRKSILFVLLFLVFVDVKNKTYNTFIFLSLFFLLIILFHQNFVDFYYHKISSEIFSQNLNNLGSGRLSIYNYSIYYFFHKMNFLEKFIGQGMGKNFIAHLEVVKTMKNSHVEVIHFMLDYGLAFIFLVIYTLYNLYNSISSNQKIVLSVLVVSFFYSIPSTYGLISLLLLISILLIDNNEEKVLS